MAYDPWLTALSYLIAAMAAYAVLFVIRAPRLTIGHIALSAVLLGFAIAGMHYVGMEAMEMGAIIRYIPSIFALSILIAIVASGAALWVVFSLTKKVGTHLLFWKVLASLVMGAAICGMHYTGMTAAVFIPVDKICNISKNAPTGSIDVEILAMMIALIIGVILSVTLAVTLYYKEKRLLQEKFQADSFPIRLLALVLIVTLVCLGWMGSYGYRLYYNLAATIDSNIKVETLSEQLENHRDKMDQAIKMYILNQDIRWKQQYQTYAAELDIAIHRYNTDYPDNDDHDAGQLIQSAQTNLLRLEGDMFAYTDKGQAEKAHNIFLGKSYDKNTEHYRAATREFEHEVKQASHQRLGELSRSLYHSLYFAAIIVVSLLTIWFFLFRSLNLWRKETGSQPDRPGTATDRKR